MLPDDELRQMKQDIAETLQLAKGNASRMDDLKIGFDKLNDYTRGNESQGIKGLGPMVFEHDDFIEEEKKKQYAWSYVPAIAGSNLLLTILGIVASVAIAVFGGGV